MLPEADRIRMRYVLDAIEDALTYSHGRTRQDLDTDTMYLRAVLNCITVIGEAANRVSLETRASTPGVPWRLINAMRNRLVHGYDDVNKGMVWETLQRDLPDLKLEILRALESP